MSSAWKEAALTIPPALICGPVTPRLTDTVCGLLLAPIALTAIEPLYVPGLSPAGLTETVGDAGVVPPVGVTDSQKPDVATVKAAAVVPDSVTVCEGGGVEPARNENVSPLGVAEIVGAARTVRPTETNCGELVTSEELMVIVAP